MQRCLLITLVFLGVIGGAGAAENEKWTALAADQKLDAFKKPDEAWVFTEEVKLDATNPKKLAGKEGKGAIFFNGAKGRARDLVTKDEYGDCEVHLEFLIPKGSNSGIKLHAVYEIQIYDSFGKEKVKGDDCGGIYPRADLLPTYHHIDEGIAPKVNAAKAPGEWQMLDIVWQAPRFDADGKKTTNAKFVKVTLNDKVIHENQEVATPTGHNWKNKETPRGPILLQGDHGPVAFREIRVRPVK
jgi:hypothetical protein